MTKKVDTEGYEKNLEKSIRKYGVLIPLVYSYDGMLIDGKHRLPIIEKLRCEGINIEVRKTMLPMGINEVEAIREIHTARRKYGAEALRQLMTELSMELESRGLEGQEVINEIIDMGYAKMTVYRYIDSRFKTRLSTSNRYSKVVPTGTTSKNRFPVCEQCEYKLYYQEKNKVR